MDRDQLAREDRADRSSARDARGRAPRRARGGVSRLYFGTPDYGGDCTIEDAQRILDANHLAGVRSLALSNSMFGDELADRVVAAQFVRQLRPLDLSKSTLGDAGAAMLLAHAAALEHLEVLDVSECYLGVAMVVALRERQPQVASTAQRIDDVHGRYVVVSE